MRIDTIRDNQNPPEHSRPLMRVISNMQVRPTKPMVRQFQWSTMMRKQISIIYSMAIISLIALAGIAAAEDNQTGQADVIPAYTGSIGPGTSLYGLKLAFENLDESFTFNQSERLHKQIYHADLRLAEIQRELIENRTDLVDVALEQYRMKINQTDAVLEPLPSNATGNVTGMDEAGLVHAREMIMKHQEILGNLLQSHPNNTGLERAYQNSIALEQKFERNMENARMIRQQTNPDRSYALPDNQTAPADWAQLQDKNKFSGNMTNNRDQNRQGTNLSLQDTHAQQNNTTGNDNQVNQNGQGNKGGFTSSPSVDNTPYQNTKNNGSDLTPTGVKNGRNSGTNENSGASDTGDKKTSGRDR